MKIVRDILNLTKKVKETTDRELLPPEEIAPSDTYPILPYTLFENTRGYLEKINHQINSCYRNACYDACAVMIRRLIEVLIIEVFNHRGMTQKIQNPDGDFLFLEDLINKILAETSLGLRKNTKKALRKKEFKTIGDQSAHGWNYNAHRTYIDDIKTELREVSENLLYLANLKK